MSQLLRKPSQRLTIAKGIVVAEFLKTVTEVQGGGRVYKHGWDHEAVARAMDCSKLNVLTAIRSAFSDWNFRPRRPRTEKISAEKITTKRRIELLEERVKQLESKLS
jgi:hypothetical protein